MSLRSVSLVPTRTSVADEDGPLPLRIPPPPLSYTYRSASMEPSTTDSPSPQDASTTISSRSLLRGLAEKATPAILESTISITTAAKSSGCVAGGEEDAAVAVAAAAAAAAEQQRGVAPRDGRPRDRLEVVARECKQRAVQQPLRACPLDGAARAEADAVKDGARSALHRNELDVRVQVQLAASGRRRRRVDRGRRVGRVRRVGARGGDASAQRRQ